MKKKRNIIIIIVVISFILLWFSDVLPKQVVKVVSSIYILKEEGENDYILKAVEYSPAHDSYFAYFYNKNAPNDSVRNIGVYYRWFPFHVYFDSNYPG